MPGVLKTFKLFEQQENVVTEYVVGIPSGEVIDVSQDEFAKLKKARVLRYDQHKKMFTFLDANYSSVRRIISNSPERLAYIDYIMDALKVEKYKIKEDLTVDVDGDVDFSVGMLKKIPVKFGKVTGNFNCSYNALNNLTNSPTQIGGIFNCSGNEIYTLIKGPSYVAGGYFCTDNRLENLEGFPMYCEIIFDARRNKLKSLNGCPEKINCRKFDVSYNNLRNLKGGPKMAIDYDCSHNQITTLVGGPVEVKGKFDCTHNNLYNLLGMPTHYQISYDDGNQIDEIEHD